MVYLPRFGGGGGGGCDGKDPESMGDGEDHD